MAERKAVNKYYPPDWDPSKGSINKHVGQHPLRERARKLSQGILVIRFEMPYNIWCGGCNSHIGMGVRYNAEKSKTGNYYTTPIYKFRMKCHLCPNYFEIQTDPKNHDYVILNGARRKEQRWDPKENEQIVPEDKRTQKKLATDAMYKLEHGSDDQGRGRSRHSSVANIEESREVWKDDYILNKILRQEFRDKKKAMKESESQDQALLDKSSLAIPLVAETEEDKKLAGLMKYSVTDSYDEKQKQKRKAIESRPIFSSSSPKLFKSDPTHKRSKSEELKKKLVAGSYSNSISGFGSMSPALNFGPVKELSLAIRRKSVEKDSMCTRVVAQLAQNNCDTKDSASVAENDDLDPIKDSGSSTEKVVSDPEGKLTHLSSDLEKEESTDCDKDSTKTNSCDNSTVISQNALKTIISNYSDSESDEHAE